jgi:iron complex outermembrane recepter protein
MQFVKAPLTATVALIVGTYAQDARAQAAAGAPQPLPPTVVTASPIGSDLFDTVEPVNVLRGQGLRLRQQPTLGETVGQEVGVSSSYFGPNSSRPIIRGLGAFDVRLLQNGLGITDVSAMSPDHTVATSPFAAEQIEVVRGPATVMYGGNAVGGVVNVIDGRIAREGMSNPTQGAFQYRYDTASNLQAGGLAFNAGNQAFVLHLDGYKSNNQDLKIPGSAWTGAVQDARGSPGPSGRLPNSQGDTDTFGVGGSIILGDRGYAGLSYSQFNSTYGTVAEENVTIKLNQSAWNFAGELRNTIPGLDALRVKYVYTDYQHTEFESGIAGTLFQSNGYNLRVEGQHVPIGPLRGAIGLEAANIKFSALGAEAFVPSTKTTDLAGFIYEELPFGPWKFVFGGRIANTKLDAAEFEQAGQPAASRSFTPWSVAAGALYAFTPQWGMTGNLSYTQRAPTVQELFANGPHLATDQFVVGDQNLNKVESTAVDLALKWKSGPFTASAAAFYNRFSNYIALIPTDIFRNPEDRSVAPSAAPIVDPVTGDVVNPVQQFNYQGVRARFWGIELKGGFPVWSSAGQTVSVGLQGDYVNAQDLTNGQPLPFIPPLRAGATLGYQRDAFTAGLGFLAAAAQTRVPQFQTTTAGYANVFLNASYLFKVPGGGPSLEAFLQANNLLDQTIRYSTSELKDIAPLGARAIMAGVRGAW